MFIYLFLDFILFNFSKCSSFLSEIHLPQYIQWSSFNVVQGFSFLFSCYLSWSWFNFLLSLILKSPKSSLSAINRSTSPFIPKLFFFTCLDLCLVFSCFSNQYLFIRWYPSFFSKVIHGFFSKVFFQYLG